jgi:hypothetical protein
MCQPDYQDDASIANDDRLYRRIHLSQLVRDEDTGLARVSSGAFRDKDLSVNIESVLQNEGKSAPACLQNHLAHKLMSLTAVEARQHRQCVCRDPLPHDLSHGLVFGSKSNRRILEGLRDSAKWMIPSEAPLYVDVLQEKRANGIPD